MATIELDSRYAPIPDDTRAILRQKTLLGETYVELTPGTDEAPSRCPRAAPCRPRRSPTRSSSTRSSAPSTQPTRAAFQAWMQGQAAALRGPRRRPLADDRQPRPVRRAGRPGAAPARLAVRRRSAAWSATAARSSARSPSARASSAGLIQNAERRSSRPPRDRNEDLATAFVIFPTFLRESRETLARLESFARDADPVVSALRPAAKELAPTFAALGRLSNAARPLLRRAADDDRRARRPGFSALRRILDDDLPPILEPPRPVPRRAQLGARGPAPLQARDHRLPRQRRRRHQRASSRSTPRSQPAGALPAHEAPLTPEVALDLSEAARRSTARTRT